MVISKEPVEYTGVDGKPVGYLIAGGLLVATLCASVLLGSAKTHADDIVDDITITVPVSCTMSGTSMDSHTAEITNGTYQDNIGTTTLKAFCNDNNGFAIYAAGYTGEEVGGTNSTKLVGTPAAIGNIDTGIAESGNTSNWAMKLATNASATYALELDNGYNNYSIVPSDYVKVAHRDSATDIPSSNTTATGAELTTTYAAYISQTQPAGTYSGKVIYTLVHPADAAKPIVPKSLDTATTLQDVTYCSQDLPENQVYTLTDSRDGQTYKAARLADGNCWMLDNLALDPTDSTTAANMNETNTNATAAAITNLLNGGNAGGNAGWSNVAVANVATNFNNNDSYIQPRINNASKDTLVTSYGPAATSGQAKVGIYYNFCAASASTYCYAGGSGVDVPDTLIDASQDICPANWRMPTGYYFGEYKALADKYSSDATNSNSFQYNLSTPLSGSYYNSSAYDQGSRGGWWSSTYDDRYYMNGLNVDSSSVGPYNHFGRSGGFSMRCLVGE